MPFYFEVSSLISILKTENFVTHWKPKDLGLERKRSLAWWRHGSHGLRDLATCSTVLFAARM